MRFCQRLRSSPREVNRTRKFYPDPVVGRSWRVRQSSPIARPFRRCTFSITTNASDWIWCCTKWVCPCSACSSMVSFFFVINFSLTEPFLTVSHLSRIRNNHRLHIPRAPPHPQHPAERHRIGHHRIPSQRRSNRTQPRLSFVQLSDIRRTAFPLSQRAHPQAHRNVAHQCRSVGERPERGSQRSYEPSGRSVQRRGRCVRRSGGRGNDCEDAERLLDCSALVELAPLLCGGEQEFDVAVGHRGGDYDFRWIRQECVFYQIKSKSYVRIYYIKVFNCSYTLKCNLILSFLFLNDNSWKFVLFRMYFQISSISMFL